MKHDGAQLAIIAFWISSVLMIISAFAVVFLRNLVRSAVALLFTLLMTAFVYFSLGADFLAVVQILLYVGGVIVVILFGILLTRDVELTVPFMKPVQTIPALVVAVVVGTALWKLADYMPGQAFVPLNRPLAPVLGELFLQKYLIAFEVASVLLVGVLIGSAYLVRREVREE